MAVDKMYAKGFDTGYQVGYKSGLQGSKAKLVMQRDLIFIYGSMCLALVKNHHWKQSTVENLITEIQKIWAEIGEGAETSNETMSELVERETGICLVQTVEDIVNL